MKHFRPYKRIKLTKRTNVGSERARNAKTAGATLAEAGKINESLMYLGQCLQMQSDCQDGSKVSFEFWSWTGHLHFFLAIACSIPSVQIDRAALLQLLSPIHPPRQSPPSSPQCTKGHHDRDRRSSGRLQRHFSNSPLFRSGARSHRTTDSINIKHNSRGNCCESRFPKVANQQPTIANLQHRG